MVQRIVKFQFVSLVIHQGVYQLFPERYTRDCYIACNLSRRLGVAASLFISLCYIKSSGLASHQLGKALTGIRVFCFTYVHSRKIEQVHSNILESNALGNDAVDSGDYHIACKRSGMYMPDPFILID